MSNFRAITDEWYSSAQSIIRSIDSELNNWNDQKSNKTKSQVKTQKHLIENEIKGQADILLASINEMGKQYQVVEELTRKIKVY